MNPVYLFCLLFLSLGFQVYGEKTTRGTLTSSSRSEASIHIESFVETNNLFAMQLYKGLKEENANLCLSPFSILDSLAMPFNGSAEDTKFELANSLKLSLSLTDLNDALKRLRQFLVKSEEPAIESRLFLADSLWLQSRQQIQAKFLEETSKYFAGSVREIDFTKYLETARAQINVWVKSQTKGMISEVVHPSEIMRSTRMLLISAPLFRSRWDIFFDQKVTQFAPFIVNQEKIISVPTMVSTASFPLVHHADFSFIQIPCVQSKKGPQWVMNILLPKDPQGLEQIEKQLTLTFLQRELSILKEELVILSLPRFKIAPSIKLIPFFQKIGIKQAFDEEANFSGISTVSKLKIDQALYQTTFLVEEGGVNVGVFSHLKGGQPSSAATSLFKVDHPFIFLIQDRVSGLILFIGKVSNP